jgi:hypothetical protein
MVSDESASILMKLPAKEGRNRKEKEAGKKQDDPGNAWFSPAGGLAIATASEIRLSLPTGQLGQLATLGSVEPQRQLPNNACCDTRPSSGGERGLSCGNVFRILVSDLAEI